MNFLVWDHKYHKAEGWASQSSKVILDSWLGFGVV